ncbi:MAG: L7Ae/L30e/S12e/Gadd45 family ribosomal protein [Ruminococcus sp.]|nr:ribosomal L7Ae/L30e/S12e/Gadd45 family protein [Oscillospiraceae bacterium]MDY2510081.1 ribosomal L7Ae/L30e/S12e/Gadd45 family protein [Ruminococcus callidus]
MPLQEKCRNLLTICRKAGKLEAGFARAKDAIEGGYAACVLLTADLSEKSRKEVLYYAQRKQIPVVQTDWEMTEVRLLFGQRAGILTICEKGFAKRIQELLLTEQIG